MTFDEVLTQVLELLQREKRVSYRALKRHFNLDDEYLEDLKDEIIKAKRLATDEEGSVLVWTGNPQETVSQPPLTTQQPAAQATPPPRSHLHPLLRIPPKLNAVNSRSCSAIWWNPQPCLDSSTRKTGVTWCVHISGFVPK